MNKSIFLALLAIAWFALPVRAVEPGATTNQIQAGQTKTEQLRLNMCQRIESRISFRLNQSEQNRDKHYTAFQNIRKHIDKFIERATKRNCDVTTLKSQLEEFDILVDKFSAAFRDWKFSFQAARDLRCDTSQANVTSAIQTSQGKYSLVRETSKTVLNYTKNTLKPTFITALQACDPSPKPTASPELKGNE